MFILLVKDRDRSETEWAVHGLLGDEDALFAQPIDDEETPKLVINRTEINTPAPYAPIQCWSFPDIVEATKALTILAKRGYDIRVVEVE